MNKLFDLVDEYIDRCNWTDFALLKFCLCAIGVLLGLAVPPKHRKAATGCALLTFFLTYIPLMSKFFVVCHDANDPRNLPE